MIEDYLLFLKNDKGRAQGRLGVRATGFRFFYEKVIEKPMKISVRIDYKKRSCQSSHPG